MPKRKSTDLVQIQKSTIPPLHQSTQTQTACPRFYVTTVIKGRRKPGSMEAARGTQVHRVLSQYASWCAHKSIAMDLDAFDGYAKGVGPAAAKILNGLRESYSVDFSHLLATEVPMSLDEHFQPTKVVGAIEGISGDSGLEPVYEGTLDALYVFRNESKIIIDDAKTHARPFDPKITEYALQGQMYSLFAFQFFPWVNEVQFRLWFVRYKKLTRDVVYTREDVPALIDAVKVARATQESIHSDYDAGKDIQAIGNDGCFYCPLLSDRECPILQDNPNAQGEPSEWLSSALVYSAYAKVNNARMKAWVNANGRPILLRDYNQKAFTYGAVESESNVYPLFKPSGKGIEMDNQGRPVMPIVELLTDYAYATPDDTEWMGKLVISSTKLNSALGAKKRAMLDIAVGDTADKVTKAPMKISKPLDAIPEEVEEDYEDGDGWSDDSEF